MKVVNVSKIDSVRHFTVPMLNINTFTAVLFNFVLLKLLFFSQNISVQFITRPNNGRFFNPYYSCLITRLELDKNRYINLWKSASIYHRHHGLLSSKICSEDHRSGRKLHELLPRRVRANVRTLQLLQDVCQLKYVFTLLVAGEKLFRAM